MLKIISKLGTISATALSLTVSLPAFAAEVVFINPGSNGEGFWGNVANTMSAAAEDLGIELEILPSDRNRIKLVANLEEVMSRGNKPDYLIAVNEEQYGDKAVELVKGTDTKLLFLLNDLTEEQKKVIGKARTDNKNWLGSVTPDAEFGGYEMGKSIIDASISKFGEDVQIFAIAGDKVTPSSIARNSGLERAVEESGKAKIVRFLASKWDKDTSYKLTQRFIASSAADKVTAFWGGNDDISIGIMDALNESGKKAGEDYFIAGLNWSKPALDLVNSGKMTLTHGGHFFAGAWSMIMIYDYDQGKDFQSENINLSFPMSAIDGKNVKIYLENLGDADWSLIDFSKFSKFNNPSINTYQFTLERILEAL